MRVTVCELSDSPEMLASEWDRLTRHVRQKKSDLVLLPEMAFFPWLFWRRMFDAALWEKAKTAHDNWLQRLGELAPAWALGTRPADSGNLRLNQGFVWNVESGIHAAHTKYYLPDEEGYWEASWYSRGSGEFKAVRCGRVLAGFLICTDIWFFFRSRQYGKQGAHLLVCPRATPWSTADKWLVAGRAAAVASGAYCLSSNRVAPHGHRADLGGQGWIIEPDGKVLGITSQKRPFLTCDIDLARAEKAKGTYPRYVAD